MKKWFSLLFLFIFAIGIVTGCGSNGASEQKDVLNGETSQVADQSGDSGELFPITVTDAVGEDVIIEAKPERIVSLMPSNTEIAFALGLGDKIVGVSDYDNYPEEVNEIEKIGGLDLNIEKIISLSPDLVLAHESIINHAREGLEQIQKAGIKVIVVNDGTSFHDVYRAIEMIGQATGVMEKAETIIEEMKNKVKELQEKTAQITEKKKVIIEVFHDPITVVGKNTFMDEMLQTIHAENGVGDLEGWPTLEPEAYIERNPDVIITTYGLYTENVIDSVLNRDGWSEVEAIKNKQVFDVHPDLVTRSGPRLAEGIEELAKAIYPEVFNE